MFKNQPFKLLQMSQRVNVTFHTGTATKRNEKVNMNGEQSASEKDGACVGSDDQTDRTKLIINYLPQFATEEELASIFSQVGRIENIRIMRDIRTGYSYGFGFVKYTKPEDAAKAIEVINGMSFRNKRLKVSYSRPPGPEMKDSNLYIENLPKNVTEEDLDRMFGDFGEIIQRTILKDKITRMPRGVAFVRFANIEEAQAAITALDGKQLENAMLPLSIRVAEDHGRQKAQYVDYVNHVCLFNNRDRQQFVVDKLAVWKQMNLHWLYNFIGPSHVAVYEQVVNSMLHTLTVLLEFLGVPISDHHLPCTLGLYRRTQGLLNFDPDLVAMKKRLQDVLQKVDEESYNVASPAKKKR